MQNINKFRFQCTRLSEEIIRYMSEEWDDSLANQTPEEFTQRCALELSRFSGQVKIKQKGVELAKNTDALSR